MEKRKDGKRIFEIPDKKVKPFYRHFFRNCPQWNSRIQHLVITDAGTFASEQRLKEVESLL